MEGNGIDVATAAPQQEDDKPSEQAAQEPAFEKPDKEEEEEEEEAVVRSAVPAPQEPEPAAYEPAPPNRSKKRKAARNVSQPESMVRLGAHVERDSERLMRGRRPVRLSTEEKAPQILLDDSQFTASSTKGYRTVRCTHGAYHGTWYYEVSIEYLGKTGAVRLGWSTRESELQAPVGFDGLGYGYRSVEGSKVHHGVKSEYGKCFKEGDVVGCLMHLPYGGRPLEKTPRDVVKYKGQLYYTEDQNPPEAQPLAGSFVEFFVNGESQGRAFVDTVKEGTYYPAISLYTDARQLDAARVKVNFGETPFAHHPGAETSDGHQIKPSCELPHAAPVDQS